MEKNLMSTQAKPKQSRILPSTQTQPDFQAIIVGCGFGGMGAAIQLRRMGWESILMLDREAELGGTWHVNSYPGLAVDIASFTYSYSFEPNPNWSRLYAPGAELKEYANHVASKYDLRRHMRFNSSIEEADYDEKNRVWTVYPQGQEPVTARILILATGFLSQPNRPNIKGIDDFKGKVIHTAAWDHDYDLTGKRAAVIGTGATGVQLIPAIAPQLVQLDVYQRTPIWVTPKLDGPIPAPLRKLFAALPATQKGARLISSSILETIMVTGVLYNKQLPFLIPMMENVCKRHMARSIKDKTLRKKLTPAYSFGCKRPTFSNTYYPTFTRDNVALVTDSIDHIEADAIVTNDGKRRVIDTLILATGYDLWEKNFPAFTIAGKSGKNLGQWWRNNHFQAYQGISIPDFPNLFCLAGPYAYNGLSFFSTIEGQMKHIARCLTEMQKQQADTFEVTEDANARFLDDMKRRVDRSLFVHGHCGGSNSYYFNQHGEATLLRPTSTPAGFWAQQHFPLSAYRFA
jgi:cation diffusion facilitator CzcD-associated flavoprotein CzcO